MDFKKHFTPLNIVFATEVIVIALVSLGLLPREAVLFLTGLLVFYLIFSPVEDGLYLAIASIPIFVALPISASFDSMANWRILIAVLFLCLVFKKWAPKIWTSDILATSDVARLGLGRLEYLTLAFLLIAGLSIFVADYKILAVKKLLFLINIFLLFLVVTNLAKERLMLLKIWQAMAAAGIVVIATAAIQFLAVLFIPLYTFWQFWADKVIAVFYGQNLAHLLSFSNTWFAYYGQNPPTLRLFSVFPDSHSLAMFCILLMPIFLSLALFFAKEKAKRIFFWLMTILALSVIILTGSRGAWLSLVPVVAVVLYLFGKKIERPLINKALMTFLLFAFLFLISNFYPPLLYKFQSWQPGGATSTSFAFFERAKSISDFENISNKGRLEIWRASLKSLVKYPILGVGLGNYVKVLEEDVSAAKKGASAHNLYLDFANEIGIFGALILIVIFGETLWTAWLVFKNAKEPHFKMFGLVFGLYFLWVIVYSLFDVVLLNDKVLLFFMVELGVLYGIKEVERVPEKN